jgi:hypothetical protein
VVPEDSSKKLNRKNNKVPLFLIIILVEKTKNKLKIYILMGRIGFPKAHSSHKARTPSHHNRSKDRRDD